jgi:hypothetical protein
VGLFTLAGVALAFTGQWLMERRRIERTRTGVLKAILGELRHNGGFFVEIRAVGLDECASTYSTDTWEAARFELAQFVPDDIFDDVLFIYEDMLPRVRSSSFNEMGDPLVYEERIKRSMKNLLSLPQASSFRTRWKIRLRD